MQAFREELLLEIAFIGHVIGKGDSEEDSIS